MKNQINHSEYIAKTKKMDEATLRFIIKDCQEALKALPNCDKAGYYQDEICYCAMELKRRNLNK
jgi:hypothetical protein